MRYASEETWDQYRQKMLADTSRFIEWGLRHPEQVLWIPSKPVEQGSFPRAVADWFWSMALSDGDSRWAAWRARFSVAARLLRLRH